MKRNILALFVGLGCVAMSATAQPGSVTFEEGANDYTSVGVWDAWEQSPFMTGRLTGWGEVIDNPFAVDAEGNATANPSQKVAVFQRSPYGSNQYGVAIRLPKENRFFMKTSTQYVHVLVNRPVKGRIMLMGLGHKTSDAWKNQREEVLQFAELSQNKGTPNQWSDIVFPIIGRNDVEINTLVVAVDCESPHKLQAPFLAYVDDIIVNTSSTPRVAPVGDYPICFEYDTPNPRSDRQLKNVKVATANGTVYMQNDGKRAYTEAFSRYVPVKAGETIKVTCSYTGSWMHSFVYLDKNDNGKFDMDGNEELMAYNNTASNGFGVTHKVTIPATLTPGIYRMRAKVDWESTDPAGNADDSNHILNNGGGIIDFLLNVYDPNAMADITNEQRNGDILLLDGSKMSNYQHPILQPLTVKAVPAPGFECSGMIIKHGYNLSGEQMKHSNPQYLSTQISHKEFEDDGTYIIAGNLLDGEVAIEGLMVESGTVPDAPTRYTTTKVSKGQFQGVITWYSIQIAAAGYVVHNNGTAKSIALSATTVDPDNDDHLWCFDGDDEQGYLIYNRAEGATKVLASSTDMTSNTGGSTFPILVDAANIPEGYVARWNFSDSQDLGNGVQYAYMYQMGFPDNRVNYRDGKFAFWTGGADKGSTLTILEVKTEDSNAILVPFADPDDAAVAYDLAGRRIVTPTKGIYIKNGEKRMKSEK